MVSGLVVGGEVSFQVRDGCVNPLSEEEELGLIFNIQEGPEGRK